MRYITILLFSASFVACSKKKVGKCPLTCNTAGETVTFSGYTAEETDTVYLKTYVFDHTFTSLQGIQLIPCRDTINISGSIKGIGRIMLSPRGEYEIEIPAVAQTIRISMKDTIVTDTFMCDNIPKGGCFESFMGATATGGKFKGYSTGPSIFYLLVEK